MLNIYLRDNFVIEVSNYDDIQEVKYALESKEKFIQLYNVKVDCAGYVINSINPDNCVINMDNIILISDTKEK